MEFMLRSAVKEDLYGLLHLYAQLHPNETYTEDERSREVWRKILNNERDVICIGCIDTQIISSCHLIVMDNLTHGNRPYALIENVITDSAHRKKGHASRVLEYAKETAKSKNCYKIMLMTSSKEESTLQFYQNAGFNMQDKTAFVQWL